MTAMWGLGAVGVDAERSAGAEVRPLDVGLLNNAADAAFDGTTERFRRFVERAGRGRAIRFHVVTLASIPRAPVDRPPRIWTTIEQAPVDGLIVTGAEPRTGNLRDEAFWPELDRFFGWAEATGTPLVLSCLAAHAAVLRNDGIRRVPLREKCFGVFEEECLPDADRLVGVAARLPMPHSRWNGLDEAELQACGYAILTRSAEAGVGTFACGRTDWLHFQGHPEYGGTTLLDEYRRDVARFMRGERPTYPLPPSNCLDDHALRELEQFRQHALDRTCRLRVADLPSVAAASTGVAPRWHEPATAILANWLDRLGRGLPDLAASLKGIPLEHHGLPTQPPA